MTIFEAILLGIIQGLTEFLPISSTGHLTIAGKLLGLVSEERPEQWTAFIAVIQIGTLIAVLIYFWKDLLNITISFTKENLLNRQKYRDQSFDSRMGWNIIIGSLPVIFIGLFFKDFIEGSFTKNLYVIASSLIILGIILGWAEKVGKFNRSLKDIKIRDTLIIGFAQAMALIPGSSRSGTTITAGLFLGLKRETAARYSFLLGVPAIFGSGLYELISVFPNLSNDDIINLIVATIMSAISGYLSIKFLLHFLKTRTTLVFIVYRVLLGIAIFILIGSHILTP